jgi:hypothetical protein
MYFGESRFILSTKCCDSDSHQNLFWEFMTSNYPRTLNTNFIRQLLHSQTTFTLTYCRTVKYTGTVHRITELSSSPTKKKVAAVDGENLPTNFHQINIL